MSKRKIKLDDEMEVMVENSVADHVDRLEKDLKNLQDERDRVEDEIKMIRNQLEKALVERDNFKDQVSEMQPMLKSNMDDAKFQSAVKQRVQLIEIAKDYLGNSVTSKLDSMSNLEIKKEVIRTAKKTVNVDDKKEVYLDGMFDLIVEEKSAKKVNIDGVKFDLSVKQDLNSNSLEKARSEMINKSKHLINSKGVE